MVPAAKDLPVGLSCWDQMAEEPGPPDFHSRYGVPSLATKTDGSMEPPSDFWHSSGPVELSMKGPPASSDVATEMHSSLVPATSTA